MLNAIAVDDRQVMVALWKAHRARFAADGDLARMVAASSVLRELAAVARGRLVAAIVETGVSDYLVWVDLDKEIVIAAFPDARAWYAGQG